MITAIAFRFTFCLFGLWLLRWVAAAEFWAHSVFL